MAIQLFTHPDPPNRIAVNGSGMFGRLRKPAWIKDASLILVIFALGCATFPSGGPSVSAHFHVNNGLALEEKGDMEGAMSEYSKALVLNPENPEAHYGLGKTLRAQGKITEARHEFIEALRFLLDTRFHRDIHEDLIRQLHELE